MEGIGLLRAARDKMPLWADLEDNNAWRNAASRALGRAIVRRPAATGIPAWPADAPLEAVQVALVVFYMENKAACKWPSVVECAQDVVAVVERFAAPQPAPAPQVAPQDSHVAPEPATAPPAQVAAVAPAQQPEPLAAARPPSPSPLPPPPSRPTTPPRLTTPPRPTTPPPPPRCTACATELRFQRDIATGRCGACCFCRHCLTPRTPRTRTDPWFEQGTECPPCHELRIQGMTCARCKQIVRPGKTNKRAVQCSVCSQWAHRLCENLSSKDFAALADGKDPLKGYVCTQCSTRQDDVIMLDSSEEATEEDEQAAPATDSWADLAGSVAAFRSQLAPVTNARQVRQTFDETLLDAGMACLRRMLALETETRDALREKESLVDDLVGLARRLPSSRDMMDEHAGKLVETQIERLSRVETALTDAPCAIVSPSVFAHDERFRAGEHLVLLARIPGATVHVLDRLVDLVAGFLDHVHLFPPIHAPTVPQHLTDTIYVVLCCLQDVIESPRTSWHDAKGRVAGAASDDDGVPSPATSWFARLRRLGRHFFARQDAAFVAHLHRLLDLLVSD